MNISSVFFTVILASTAFSAEKVPEADVPLNPYEKLWSARCGPQRTPSIKKM